jgi:YVTN family beta-propeller protein
LRLHPDQALASVSARVPFRAAPTGGTTGDTWLPFGDLGEVWRIDGAAKVVTAKIKTGPFPAKRVTAFGSVWVTDPEAGTVSRIDPSTNRVVQRIETGSLTLGIGATADAVWVAVGRQGEALKLEPRSGRIVARVRYAPPKEESFASLVADDRDVWVQDRGTVFRIDLATLRVVATVALPGPEGRADGEVALGAGSLWVTNTVDGTVTRIDAATGKVLVRIPVLPAPRGLAFADGAVWVTSFNNGDVAVSRIDPSTNRRAADVEVGSGAADLWVDSDGIWTVAQDDEEIDRISP